MTGEQPALPTALAAVAAGPVHGGDTAVATRPGGAQPQSAAPSREGASLEGVPASPSTAYGCPSVTTSRCAM